MIGLIQKISNIGIDDSLSDVNIRNKIIIANWFAIINLLMISIITILRIIFEGLNSSILVPGDNIPFLLLFLLIKKNNLKIDFMLYFFGFLFTILLFLNLTIINLYFYDMFSEADYFFAKISFTGAIIQGIIIIPIRLKKIFVSMIILNFILFLMHDYLYHQIFMNYATETTTLVNNQNFNLVFNISYFVLSGMVIVFLRIIENYQQNLNNAYNNLINSNLLLDEQNKNLHEQNKIIFEQSQELKSKNFELNEKLDDLLKIKFKLNEIINSKDKFISILAHDLKNGLFGLEISLEGLKKTCSTDIEKAKKRLITIHKSSKNLSSLLENILTWANNQMGQISYNPKFINIKDLCGTVTSQVQSELDRKKISLFVEFNHSKQVFADIDLLIPSLRNLLMNAIKYSYIGSDIKLYTSEDESYQYINVLDYGAGISKENQEKMFKIDEKFSVPGTFQEQGTGLGLILSKEYIEANNGELTFKSTIGKGTLFTIKLHIIKTNSLS